MEKRKKRFWSLILSIVMVIGLLWAVPGDGNAAAVDYSTIWKYTGATGGVIDEDGYVKDEGKYEGGPTCKVTELSELISYDSGIYISGDVTIGNSSMVVDATEAEIEVSNSSVLQCGSFSGRIKNSGIFIIDSFDSSSFSESFYNNGTIKAKDVNLTTKVQNDTAAVYNVSNSFTVSGYNSENIGTVIASPNTKITSDGGGFNLIVNSGNGTEKRVTVSGSVDGVEAWSLFDADSSVSDVSLTIAPADSEGDLHIYGNDIYVKESFNITPPEGYAIGFDISEYDRNGLNISEEKYKSIMEDSDYRFFILRLTDYAYNFENPSEACENFDKIHFDNKKPVISGLKFKADGNEIATPDEGNTIDAKEVEVSFTVTDDNLAEISYSESDEPLSLSGSSHTETLKFQTTEDNNEDNPKKCYYIVYDKAGNEVSLGFNMVYVKEDFAATAEVTPTLLKDESGNYYYPVSIGRPDDWITTGGDEKDIIVEYKATSAPDTAYSTTCPTTPGMYMVRVTLPETPKYNKAIAQSNSFEVSKAKVKQATLTISEEITVGDKFAPSLSTDSDGKVTYKYKPASQTAYGDSDTINKDDIIIEAGNYNAIAFIDESDSYLPAKSNEVTFTVKKRKIDLGVTINSVLVGDGIDIKYTPTFDIPLDVSIKEEYKGADEDDSAYTTIIPLKGGEYKLRATITGSKIYEDASVEATFIIKKRTPSNYSVTVSDIEYGGTVTPVVTTDSDGKDLATYEYKKKAEAESAYSSEVPTEVGDYSIRATIPETDKYIKVTCESTFSIGKIDEDTATVKVPDTVIGTDYTPVLSTASDGKASAKYEYKPADAADTAYTTEKPTAAGKYMIRVTVPETSNYKEQTCTATFTISKKKPQIAEVSIAENIMFGEEIKPEANISPYDGPNSPVFEYKLQSEDDSAYTSEVPTASGKYTVRAVIAESDEWDKIITKPADFVLGEIKTPTAKVEIPDIYVGSKYEPLLTTDSDGKDKAVFEYKSADDKEAEFSKDKPTKAGKYIVRATVPETDRYHEVTCEGTFSINKIEAKDSKVKIKDTVVGNDYSTVLTTDSDGKKDAVFEYKKASEDDSKYSKTKPKSVGEYSVRATIPETDKYLKVICESTFTIDKKTPEASVKLDNQHVGVNYKPSLTTDSDGKSKAYFEYKGKDEDDDAYTKDKPKEAGDYVVRATIPATDKYKKATCEAEFSITYLKEANVTYKVSGTEGKNGYYTSDVYLVAPKGYVIAASSGDKYEDRIKYTSDVTKVYLKRKSDGARMEEITISQEIKIDKDAPQLINSVDDKNNKVDMSSDEEIYADRILLSFNDENLESAKVNGKSIMPDDNNNVAIVLDPEGGDKYFAIIIEDIAGNRYSKNIVIKASWMKDNNIPSGSKVKLSPGNGYKLQGGSWTVSGDSTVYSGNRVFYVNSAGDYVFIQQ